MSETRTMLAGQGHLLLVDDDPVFAEQLAEVLGKRGYTTIQAHDGPEAIEQYRRHRPELVLLDLAMPGMDGLDALGELRRLDPAAMVILLSGYADVPTTVRAIRHGVEDVLTKPVDLEHLITTIERALAKGRVIRHHRLATAQTSDLFGLLDPPPVMQRMVRLIEALSGTPSAILVTGEPGLGKSTVVQMIHRLSPWASQPFVRVRTAGRSAADLERDLFGQPGDDDGDRRGLVEQARGGTLFLDGVSGAPLEIQPMLLALINGEPMLRRGREPIATRTRVIAATSRDLAAEVRAGRFRADLWQRLSLFPVVVPPLRARGEEALRTLATRFLHAHRSDIGRGPLRLSDDAAQLLWSREWPGNVRQLHRVLELAFPFALDQEVMEPSHLQHALAETGLADAVGGDARYTGESLEAMERRHIARVLSMTGGHRTATARVLGITRTTLYKKMHEYGLGAVGRD